MVKIGSWADALIDVIDAALTAVSEDRPHDVSPWIYLEETLGAEQVKLLWRDPKLGPVAKAVDHYCEAAQHDRDIVFGEISILSVEALLRETRARMKAGEEVFIEKFSAFA